MREMERERNVALRSDKDCERLKKREREIERDRESNGDREETE